MNQILERVRDYYPAHDFQLVADTSEVNRLFIDGKQTPVKFYVPVFEQAFERMGEKAVDQYCLETFRIVRGLGFIQDDN